MSTIDLDNICKSVITLEKKVSVLNNKVSDLSINVSQMQNKLNISDRIKSINKYSGKWITFLEVTIIILILLFISGFYILLIEMGGR